MTGSKTISDMKPGHDKPSEIWAPGTILLNEYHVTGCLGSGGMGTVYLVNRVSNPSERFAVKTLLPAIVEKREARRLFFREIRTWIDLPQHPNLSACFFLKTIQNRLSIFAEYASQGSLKDWIVQSRITGVTEILDIAIQVARGLEEAHRHGVIHQDIKPANILMAEGQIAKVTDFGLSRVSRRETKDQPGSCNVRDDILVTSDGLTMAYCSPEQALQQKVGPGTDVWSLGLTILELFAGVMTWQYGMMAPDILERFKNQDSGRLRFKIPGGMMGFLEKCFEEKPEKRWSSMQDITRILEKNYQEVTGEDYPRRKPVIRRSKSGISNFQSDTETAESIWMRSMKWMERVRREYGEKEPMDIPETSGLSTDKARIAASLELYEEAVFLMSQHPSSDIRYGSRDYAELLLDKAEACLTIGDACGAIECCDQALCLMQSSPTRADEPDLQGCRALVIKGKSQQDIMQNSDALESFQAAAARIAAAVGPRTPVDVILIYSDICSSIALTLWNLKRAREALVYSRKSIDVLNAYPDISIDKNIRIQKIAVDLINYAIYSASAGMFEDEIKYLNESVALIQESGLTRRNPPVRAILASALMNRACSLGKRQQHAEAIPDYLAAMRLIESIVRTRATPEWRRKQSSNYNNYAQSLAATGQPLEAIRYVRKAIRIIRRLSQQEGVVHHYPEMARSYLNLAGMYTRLKKHGPAIRQVDRAIRIIEHLLKEYQKTEMLGEYAHYLITRASLLIELGRKNDAGKLMDRALPMLDQEIERTGNPQLKDIRHWAQTSVLRRL